MGSALATAAGIVTLIVSKIRCIYKRDDQGNCGPCVCGCTDKSIQESHEDIEVKEITLSGVDAVLLIPRS